MITYAQGSLTLNRTPTPALTPTLTLTLMAGEAREEVRDGELG